MMSAKKNMILLFFNTGFHSQSTASAVIASTILPICSSSSTISILFSIYTKVGVTPTVDHSFRKVIWDMTCTSQLRIQLEVLISGNTIGM